MSGINLEQWYGTKRERFIKMDKMRKSVRTDDGLNGNVIIDEFAFVNMSDDELEDLARKINLEIEYRSITEERKIVTLGVWRALDDYESFLEDSGLDRIVGWVDAESNGEHDIPITVGNIKEWFKVE